MVFGPLSAVLLAAAPPDTISLVAGMVISRSVVVRPGIYRLTPLPGDSAVVRVRGSDVVVDFGGAHLIGAPPSAPPDRASGVAILIEGGSDVTLKRARVSGYRVGLLARRVRALRLHDNDFSHNWKPRLYSGFGHESLADWLSFHHNEKDEWLRHGAALHLVEVDGGEIRGNIARQGMNGLLLVRTNRLRIWNNDFSFNSGLGIGMYRSSDNVVMHNRADYCIRGYVHGVYNRGQDSAALLIYEQSLRNTVAYNSMTHGGDGLFLWAGQSTMDSGQGGANDNLFFGNDFSFAATNGIEATFSRNRFVGNLIEGAHHGMWGGYSFQSEVRGNVFRRNTVGVAIEHGQDNAIVANRFEANQTAVRLWWNPTEPSDWGYPKHRDTRSRDYRIAGNTFTGDRVALRVENTQRVVASANGFAGVDTAIVAVGDTTGWSSQTADRRPAARLEGVVANCLTSCLTSTLLFAASSASSINVS